MKKPRMGVGVVALVAIAGVVLGASPRSAGASSEFAGPGDPANGAKVYAALKCNVCHKINGAGGPMGPDLTTIGAKRDAAWLAKYLPNPAVLDPAKPPKMKMPPTKAKGQEMDDLIAYLLTLKVKK